MAVDEKKIIVRENYLQDGQFNQIRDYFLGNQCYWYYCGNYGGGYPQMEHVFQFLSWLLLGSCMVLHRYELQQNWKEDGSHMMTNF